MTKEPFDVQQWSGGATAENLPADHQTTVPARQRAEVEAVIEKIETQQLDIAPGYKDWCNLGFAFVHAFGEAGREYFQRVSRFYPNYAEKETNEQYDHCLKARGGGVTLKTFFWLARQAGLTLGAGQEEGEETDRLMPTLCFRKKGQSPESGELSDFPVFLQKVMEVAQNPEERDLLLLGTLTVLSACLGRIYGIYDGRRVYPNLFLFVSAVASAGKGRLLLCKKLVMKIHRALRQESDNMQEVYQQELTEYNDKKGKKNASERPRKPPELMLFIPANNSSTGFFQLLADNNGKGLVIETEGDTLSLTFKSDYGNYSDGFRKAFHHEAISYYRRTDREYVEIDSPKVSAVLSGTPSQVGSLIHSSENGLFSRFMFYNMNVNPDWRDVFAQNTDREMDAYFDKLGQEFFSLYERLQGMHDIRFRLSQEQQQRFNAYFVDIQAKYLYLQGIDYIATIRRLGLIFFRICMVLSALRLAEKEEERLQKMECNDLDFEIAGEIIKVLVKHASKVFSELPEEVKPVPRKNRKEQFLDSLPAEFNRQTYQEVGRKLGIIGNTSDRYIKHFVEKGFVHRLQHDTYQKNEPWKEAEN